MTLRLRLSLVLGALAWAVAAGTAGVLYLSERNFLLSEAGERHEEALRSLAQVALESYLSQDDLMLINYTANLARTSPDLDFAYVVESERLLAHSRKELSGLSTSELPARGPGSSELRSPVLVKGKPLAEAVVGVSQEKQRRHVDAALAKTRTRILYVAAAMFAVGLAAAALLAATLSRPISALAEAALEIGRGRLETRLPVSGSDELARLAGEFNSMAQKLQQLDELKRDFVAAVTHELKSPLAAIESYLSLMLYEESKPLDPARVKIDITAIRAHTGRLSRFVTDLLDLAKIERGAFSVSLQKTDLQAVCREAVEFLRPLGQEARVTLEAPGGGPYAPVAADPERLRQVLVNLLSNALKFTPPDGRISVALENSGEGLLCSVSDTGIGLAAEDLERIFDKFEQVRTSRAVARGHKGTGLGLSICRAIMDAHGGKIWAESRPGEGSRFCFTLPAWRGEVIKST